MGDVLSPGVERYLVDHIGILPILDGLESDDVATLVDPRGDDVDVLGRHQLVVLGGLGRRGECGQAEGCAQQDNDP
jgi:hypothetical protein